MLETPLALLISTVIFSAFVVLYYSHWRQREFKVGGDEATKGMSPFPLAPGEGSGRGKFFVISKWHILVTLRC